VCWFTTALVPGDRLKLKHTTRVTPVVVERVEGIFDVHSLESPRAGAGRERHRGRAPPDRTPLALDSYEVDRITGSFVLIDQLTFATVAAGMVRPAPAPPLGGTVSDYYPVSLEWPGGRASWWVPDRSPPQGGRPAGLRAVVTVIAPDVSPPWQRSRPSPSCGALSLRRHDGVPTGHYARRPRVDGAVSAEPRRRASGQQRDDPARCTFMPSLVHRDGAVTIAVSTGGASRRPGLLLRRRLGTQCESVGDLAACWPKPAAGSHERG